MKNVEIAEGGIGRRLSGTKFVLTDKPNSDQMEVWVDEDDRKLARLYATQNGTYYPEDYDAYGFSSVTVSIHGGAALPEMPKIEMPDGTIAPVLIPEIEMPDGTLKPIDELFPEIADDPLTDIGEVKVPDTVGEEGSALTGINPDDGYTYKAEVDENGNLEVEKVPTGIAVIEPPSKNEYVFGDDFDPTGLTIGLVDKDGNLVKNKEFPTGTIECSKSPDKNQQNGISVSDTEIPKEPKGTWTAKVYLDTGSVSVEVSSGVTAKLVGRPFSWHAGQTLVVDYAGYGGCRAAVLSTSGGNRQITINGLTAYYGIDSVSFSGGWGLTDVNPDVPIPRGIPDSVGLWCALYGQRSAEQEVQVAWESPYSGVVYEDGTTVVTSDPYEVKINEE